MKKLEWKDGSSYTIEAETDYQFFTESYQIEYESGHVKGKEFILTYSPINSPYRTFRIGLFATQEEAKERAQTHYEERFKEIVGTFKDMEKEFEKEK